MSSVTDATLKVALVLGASRGIGRQMALTLAANHYRVGVAAKSAAATPTAPASPAYRQLPGSVHTVAEEIARAGGAALPLRCDVRSEADVERAVDACCAEWGRLDLLVYNAGAIRWEPVVQTPLKRFDLLHAVNTRGCYAAVQRALPRMLERRAGRLVLISPPIYNRFFRGKTPYAMGKIGMTVLTHGLGMELKGSGVSISSLWPATVIESFVTEKGNVPGSLMRKSSIMADATLAIANESTEKYNGQALIDEDLLRDQGISDFSSYRVDPENEPPRMMPAQFPSLLVKEEDEQGFNISKL